MLVLPLFLSNILTQPLLGADRDLLDLLLLVVLMYLGLWTLVEAAAWLSSGSRQGSSPDSADTVVAPIDPGLRCYAECVFCRISREIGAIQQSAHESVSNLAFINFPFFTLLSGKIP